MTTITLSRRWRVRKELPDGMFTSCEFTADGPITAERVLADQSLKRWLGADRVDDVYPLSDKADEKEGAP